MRLHRGRSPNPLTTKRLGQQKPLFGQQKLLQRFCLDNKNFYKDMENYLNHNETRVKRPRIRTRQHFDTSSPIQSPIDSRLKLSFEEKCRRLDLALWGRPFSEVAEELNRKRNH